MIFGVESIRNCIKRRKSLKMCRFVTEYMEFSLEDAHKAFARPGKSNEEYFRECLEPRDVDEETGAKIDERIRKSEAPADRGD